MDLPDRIDLSTNQLHLDNFLKNHNLFSKQITNALVKQGIVTPRILIMHTAKLLRNIENLGPQLIADIISVLAKQGWSLVETADERYVTLTRRLIMVFSKVNRPLSLSHLTQMVNSYKRISWNETEVANGAAKHPYIEEIESGYYSFEVLLIDALIGKSNPLSSSHASIEKVASEQESILLSQLWSVWLLTLSEREQQVLFSCYGIQGESPLTLQEVGNELNLTRERVRQILSKTLRKLNGNPLICRSLHNLLTDSIRQESNLLTLSQWEIQLDENMTWEGGTPRPAILPLLCDLFGDLHYLDRFHVATKINITADHLDKLNNILKRILRQHGQVGLSADELITATESQLPAEFPSDLKEPSFVLKAVNIFERVGVTANGRYFYKKKKTKAHYPTVGSGWVGKPGTRLHDWEIRLREQFNKIAWIGQIRLTEEDFRAMCHAIWDEAQDPNYFSKVMEGQPRLVPPAVFMTTMVLAARYIEHAPDDAADEFWHPYLRTVWGIEYTQAFYARCKKRFNAVIPFLEETYDFEFPRVGKAQSDVITPIYRHALIPRYMQSDFAKWLCGKWRNILAVAETPAILATQLQTDQSLDFYYSHRLRHFIRDIATAETAASLITSMATAISLHIDDAESIESVSDLLADTPIEQELWHEIIKEFSQQSNTPLSSPHFSRPRVTWVWLIDEDELCLRVQNIILTANNKLEGEPDRLAWLEASDSDPLSADIEVDITPWRMKTGERIIQDAFLMEPDGPLNGVLLLLTDRDEVAISLDIPPHPTTELQFYRLIQQGAYGIPIDISQVNDGEVLVCADQPLLFLDDDSEVIEPDGDFRVPYPLTNKYSWAAQLTLSLPVTIQRDGKETITVESKGSQSLLGQVSLRGTQLLPGLSRQVQPTFTNTEIFLRIEFGGERLLKQTSIWMNGQDGWRWQQSLAELYRQGHVSHVDDSLHIDLGRIIPSHPNFYTVQLRSSLQSILPVPLQFAVVPDLTVNIPLDVQLYTPVEPFVLVLDGLDESVIVRNASMTIDMLPGRLQQIVWTDLRHEPRLVLRFDTVDIPLAWSVPRFMAWLDPKPTKTFLTLDEVYQSTIHVVDSHTDRGTFTLFVSGHYRTFSLKQGRSSIKIGQSPLYDMVRLDSNPYVQVRIQVGADTWTLFEVCQRPELPWVRVEYDTQKQVIVFNTGLQEEWAGNYRVLIENLTNPFVPVLELAKINLLKDEHLFPILLADGIYDFQIEMNGTQVFLNKEPIRFKVGESSTDLLQAKRLSREIRDGQLVTPDLAEDFVLNLTEMAETGEAALTPTVLYQLATISHTALEYISPNHLDHLWPALSALKAVHNQSSWIESQGFLPALVLLPRPIILKMVEHGFPLRVYPIEVLQGGRTGKGYGRWRLSTDESSPKELVYVEWRSVSGIEVQVTAGLPDHIPNDWANIDLLDTYGLRYCSRCGRLTGTKSFTLPDIIISEHLHGYASADLRDITQLEEYDGYHLLAEFYTDRRERLLTDIYQEFEIACPLASSYLPEPSLPSNDLFVQSLLNERLVPLVREIMRYGADRGEASPWASAVRLLSQWKVDESVSELGQLTLALSMLVRTAAYDHQQFYKLLANAQLSESSIKDVLTALHKASFAHLQWGMTWAELLILHSPGKIQKEDNE